MSWISMLCEVYDNCESEIGKKSPNGSMLFPVAHSTAEAQIEILIDGEGNFIRANRVAKEDATTLIPVTEDSASRGNGNNPMPLCDKLCYIAGDFDECLKPDKSMKAYYRAYMKNLEMWAMEQDTPQDVKAVYQYLKKGTVVSDLQRTEVFQKDSDFVRFIVFNDTAQGIIRGVWEKEEIARNFIDYYLPKLDRKGIDYVTGKETALTGKLPSKIRNSGDKAKLISSNDTAGYTFRGRFLDADQAVGIGYLTGQKAHNALRWLISKQGYRNDSECIVSFSNGQAEPPNPCRFNLFEEMEEKADTKENYARQINLAIAGYKVKFNTIDSSKIAVISVDTADGSFQGRLAVNYYTEMHSNEFLDNLEKWQQECIWEHNYHKNKEGKYIKSIGAPLPRDIVLAAYGTERGSNLEVDGKVRKKCIDRILPCITERKRFPRDIMLAAVRNAGDPQRYHGYNAHKILTIACALVHKCQIDAGKEVYDMSLKKESTDRSYLFGRLLAIADKLEEQVYFKDKVQGRETNARKFWSTFVRKPAKTWAVIYDKLLPYMNRLSGGSKNYYSLLLEEVLGKLEDTNAYHNEQLKENYLLGYYSQYEALRKKEDKDE